MHSSPVRLALVEDHPQTRAALELQFGDFPDRVQVVAVHASAESFQRALQRGLAGALPDVVLVDLVLPDKSGGELIRWLSSEAPSVRALALTAFDDEQHVMDAVHAGAAGYLLKDEAPEKLVRAIEEVAAGRHPISSRVGGHLLEHARRALPPVSLSDRESELAAALAEGLSYADCAERMGIAVGTVQDYVKRLYRKLEVGSRKEVREWVERHGARV